MMIKPLAAVLSLGFALSPSLAAAATCLVEVDQLAASHGLATETPPVPPAQAPNATGRKLEDSGGVIRPPDVDGGKVVQPPPTSDAMPTTPPLQNEAPPDARAAEQRSQVEGILQAARQAGRNGDEAGCFARLAQAKQQLAQQPDLQ